MRRTYAVLATVLLSFPAFSHAADAPISRRDGFVMIWESIKRPVEPTRETPFVDVQKGDPGFAEITYGKARGMIDDDEDSFRPTDALDVTTALLWLFRTRNVDDFDELDREHLEDLFSRYPLLKGSDRSLTEEELLSLMRRLDAMLAEEVHEASLYSEKFQGKGTAFGESFNMHDFTAAHRTFPHNTLVRVTNVANGKSVTVRINDRGPFVEGRDMDLSLASFLAIEDRAKGKLNATFVRLGDATLVSGCAEPQPEQKRITRNVILTTGVPHFFRLGRTLKLRSASTFGVDEVRYPDGNVTYPYDWIYKGETFEMTPSVEGEYGIKVRTVSGRKREMVMKVVGCGS